MPDEISIANSSVLIALESSGLLDTLEKLYGTVRIPEAVAREWSTPAPGWVHVQSVQNQELVQSLRLRDALDSLTQTGFYISADLLQGWP
jgi:predicted nucleic acid-binding protein